MEKFKKLNRIEMRKISGGQQQCSNGMYVLCVEGCFLVDGFDFCPTPAQFCTAYGGVVSNGCSSDDQCMFVAQGPCEN